MSPSEQAERLVDDWHDAYVVARPGWSTDKFHPELKAAIAEALAAKDAEIARLSGAAVDAVQLDPKVLATSPEMERLLAEISDTIKEHR